MVGGEGWEETINPSLARQGKRGPTKSHSSKIHPSQRVGRTKERGWMKSTLSFKRNIIQGTKRRRTKRGMGDGRGGETEGSSCLHHQCIKSEEKVRGRGNREGANKSFRFPRARRQIVGPKASSRLIEFCHKLFSLK